MSIDLEILHGLARYEEGVRSSSSEPQNVHPRKMIRELRNLGYRIKLIALARQREGFRPWLSLGLRPAKSDESCH